MRVMTEDEMKVTFGDNWMVDCSYEYRAAEIKPWAARGKLEVLGHVLSDSELEHYHDSYKTITIHTENGHWCLDKRVIVSDDFKVTKKARLKVEL